MPNKYFYFFIVHFIFCFSFSQQNELNGKIMAKTNDLEGVYIINLSTHKGVTSGSGGYFKIKVSAKDTLQFTGVQFEGKKVVITENDLKLDLFFVNLELANYNLKEVVIGAYKDINAVSLGILSKPAKKHTPAERRLYTATGGGNTYGLSTQVSLDGILNSISGRTSMLKKEVEVEKKEYLLRKLGEWFEDDFYTDQLNIPCDYIKGFQFYLVENIQFQNTVKAKNRTLATFLMGEIATSYLEIIDEKKQ